MSSSGAKLMRAVSEQADGQASMQEFRSVGFYRVEEMQITG